MRYSASAVLGVWIEFDIEQHVYDFVHCPGRKRGRYSVFVAWILKRKGSNMPEANSPDEDAAQAACQHRMPVV